MDKFLLILFFIIKILVIIVAPITLYILRNKGIKDYFYYLEGIALLAIIVLYIIGFPYIKDSSFNNISNIKLLGDSIYTDNTDFYSDLSLSNTADSMEADNSYRTHRNEKVYYYNGFDMPLSGKKIDCDNEYDYFKYYSDIITSTAMLLSSYFDKTIDPINVYNKAYKAGLIKCNEPINQDQFFNMIYNEYKVNFAIINNSQLKNYILNGKIVLLESNGNGVLSCNKSYFLVYDVNNKGDYLLLDPNNKSYSYICPDGTSGFGNALKANYNENTFSASEINNDTRRLIVIGGTR